VSSPSATPLDTAYVDTFFRELSPVWINYVAALAGAAPVPLDRPFTYLELGCGFGNSTVIHAGALPNGTFHACDLNAQHIQAARAQADLHGVTNVTFHQCSFEALPLDALPRFDVVALHGVYSWVDAPARAAIRHIMDTALKPGGLVYLSYNCLPGWAAEQPLRRLLMELAATAPGNAVERAHHALQHLQQLSRAGSRYFTVTPEAVAALESYARQPINYLVHEFFSSSWEAFYSVDVASELAPLGLELLGSATLADNHPPLVLDAASLPVVAAIPDPRQAQLAMDFAVNRRFRRDVFVRGRPRLSSDEVLHNVHAQVVGTLDDPERMETRVRVPRGDIRFQLDFIRALRGLLTGGAVALGDVMAALAGPDRDPVGTARNLAFLVASGALRPFARPQQLPARPTQPRAANPVVERVLQDAVSHGITRAIPSAALGTGMEVTAGQALGVQWVLRGATTAPLLEAALRTQPAAPKESAQLAAQVLEHVVPRLFRGGVLV
jgi:SAM-dependent methyltransferase